MKILDVFSWLPEKELSIEQIKNIFLMSCEGIDDNIYVVAYAIPDNAELHIIECKNELLSEGKMVAYIMRGDMVVSLIGYKN